VTTLHLTLFEGGNERLSEHERLLRINLRMIAGYWVSREDERLQREQIKRELAMTPEEFRAYQDEVLEESESWS
jgi:hypothetical protein